MRTRNYEDTEQPRIGDVVELFDGAFSAGIVTELPRDAHPNGDAIVERVHSYVSNGQLRIGVERLRISFARLRQLPVFVTGQAGNLDNREA